MEIIIKVKDVEFEDEFDKNSRIVEIEEFFGERFGFLVYDVEIEEN